MNGSFRHSHWLAGPLAAVLLMATLAPAAQAGQHGKRYKHKQHSSKHVEHSHRGGGHGGGHVYVSRRSSAGPAIAGFLGGLFVGAAIAHAAPSGYSYHDPYCHQRFASLEIYRGHLHRHHHPRFVQVIQVSSGDCVRVGRYDGGHWHDAGDYWDPRWERTAYAADWRGDECRH